MRVYVAAPWTRRADAKALAEKLVEHGHTITHEWWEHEAGDHEHAELARLAKLDMNAVLDCRIFVLLNLEKSEGKAVETGLALGAGKMLIGIGPRYSNIFQYLGRWSWFPDALSFVTYLRGETAGTADGTALRSIAFDKVP